MRSQSSPTPHGFVARAISGTRAILIALNCPEEQCQGLLGFSFERQVVGSGRPKFLRSQKVFRSIVPDPKHACDPNHPNRPRAFYTDEFPVQSFLWGDYAATPGTAYRFRIFPRYGRPGALTTDERDIIQLEITTEKEWGPGETHGVWFNRGAIASQKFAEEFENKPPEDANNPKDPRVEWLSRGLLEACLAFINETKVGDALRVAAYEFTYPPVLNALKALIDRGFDVKIVYHDTREPKTGTYGENEAAMEAAGLRVDDGETTFPRAETKIPHNKFIVRLAGGTNPVEVWTGSTNFTASGFLGQSNVGHRVADPGIARRYFEFWKVVQPDPKLAVARAQLATLTPEPPETLAGNSLTPLFSPRAKSDMLDWYGRRMLDAANSVWFTAAFGINEKLTTPIAQKRPVMRFVLLEKPLAEKKRRELTADFGRVILSYGVPLGEVYEIKDGKVSARKRIKEFELDKWFFKEEHYRRTGFVFFVHTKFLLIDPLSDDPQVYSGSANFSPDSLQKNDENMLLIRGNTRVADIYLTEFDRIFRHFYFRDIANELASVDRSEDAKSAFLDETEPLQWWKNYFKPRCLKNNRREMFFPVGGQPGG